MAPARRPDHREAILRAALRLSSKNGLDAVSTAEVCRESGASNGTMFHYFPSKEALHAALYLRALAGYQAAIVAGLGKSRSARDGIRGIVAAHVRWVLAHPDEARFLHEGRRGHTGPAQEQEIRAQNEGFFGAISQWLRPHIESGTVRAYPVDVLVALLFGPVHTLTRGWLRGGDGKRLREVTPDLADAAWAALAAPAPKKRPRR